MTGSDPGMGLSARRPPNESELGVQETLEHLECRHSSRARHLYAEGIELTGKVRYSHTDTERSE